MFSWAKTYEVFNYSVAPNISVISLHGSTLHVRFMRTSSFKHMYLVYENEPEPPFMVGMGMDNGGSLNNTSSAA